MSNWINKYVPTNLNEYSEYNDIVDIFRTTSFINNLSHIILCGPPGCGKSTFISILVNTIFKNNTKDKIIELNASDERGINTIREKIKKFAKQISFTDSNVPVWKLIVLEEIEIMTLDAQFALRRIIEQYSHITRFCLVCNTLNKVIEPLISRCSLLRFNSFPKNKIYDRLNYICDSENIKINSIILDKISYISFGDMRKAINILQKTISIKISEIKLNDINNLNNYINEQVGILPDFLFVKLTDSIMSKNKDKLLSNIENIHKEGYSIVNQLDLFYTFIMEMIIPCDIKIKLINKLNEINMKLINGSDEYIQLLNISFYIMINV